MRGKFRWNLLLMAVIAALALAVAACGDDDEDAGAGGSEGNAAPTATAEGGGGGGGGGSTVADIKEKGEIVIGVKYDVPPFGFQNPQTNEVEGFDIDLGKAVAEDLGVEPKFIEAISDNRIPFLQNGTADLILSTMTINEERVAEIDFSEPYFIAEGRILTKKDNADIKGVEDLAGKKVCTVLGSTYEATLKAQAPDADLQLVDTYSECLELIQNGTVDAVSTDDVILTGMIIQDDSLQLVGENLTTEPYGAGIAKGNESLKEAVDDTLEAYKEDGRWDETYEKWIGQYTGEPGEAPDIDVDEAVQIVKEQTE